MRKMLGELYYKFGDWFGLPSKKQDMWESLYHECDNELSATKYELEEARKRLKWVCAKLDKAKQALQPTSSATQNSHSHSSETTVGPKEAE